MKEVNKSTLRAVSRLSQDRLGSASEFHNLEMLERGGLFCPQLRLTCVSCRKHYREYLVSLINAHSLDPALLYNIQELIRACERYQVDPQRGENEEDNAYHARLLKVRRIQMSK